LLPVTEFREEISHALMRREARQLIELCEIKYAACVSFETAETKTAKVAMQGKRQCERDNIPEITLSAG
jgi:hypothetical protein